MQHSKIITALLIFLHPFQLSGDVHTITGYVIRTQGLSLPEYIEQISVNDLRIFYYDSTMKSTPPCPKWLNSTAGQNHWHDISDISHINRQNMNLAYKSAVQQFNLTGSLSDGNIYQAYGQCVYHPNGTRKSSLVHAFNGNDFLSLDIDSMAYIASSPHALVLKTQRENNPDFIKIITAFYKRTCFERLKIFLEHAPGANIKKVPQVNIFEKQSAGYNLLTCHVTGFYPQTVQVQWINADIQLVDDDINNVLPNNDGTYQIRSVMRLEENSECQNCHCVVYHSSIPTNITVTWDKSNRDIRSFRLLVLIPLLIFVVTVAGCLIRCRYKKV